MVLHDGTTVNAAPHILRALATLLNECREQYNYASLKSYETGVDKTLGRGIVKAEIYWRQGATSPWVAYLNDRGETIRIAYPLEAQGVRL